MRCINDNIMALFYSCLNYYYDYDSDFDSSSDYTKIINTPNSSPTFDIANLKPSLKPKSKENIINNI